MIRKKALDKEEADAIKKAELDAKTELTRLDSINKIQEDFTKKKQRTKKLKQKYKK